MEQEEVGVSLSLHLLPPHSTTIVLLPPHSTTEEYAVATRKAAWVRADMDEHFGHTKQRPMRLKFIGLLLGAASANNVLRKFKDVDPWYLLFAQKKPMDPLGVVQRAACSCNASNDAKQHTS